MKTKLILFLSALALVACGKGSGSSAAASKELFSVWTRNADGFVLDLDGGSFGVGKSYAALFAGGEICDCQFSVLGTQSAGNWALASCTYRTGSGGGSDPGCASGNSSGTYTNAGAVLSVCESGTCLTYR